MPLWGVGLLDFLALLLRFLEVASMITALSSPEPDPNDLVLVADPIPTPSLFVQPELPPYQASMTSLLPLMQKDENNAR